MKYSEFENQAELSFSNFRLFILAALVLHVHEVYIYLFTGFVVLFNVLSKTNVITAEFFFCLFFASYL